MITTKNAERAVPISLFTDAIAATHGVYNRVNTKNTSAENGVNKVGQLTGNFTAAQVQQLFAQAKIGDVIQASTTASSGQHTMIFTGLTSKGITVYDCNAAVNGCAPGGCGINEWERSYSELAKGTYGYGSSNGGITIYRADNYASIYGDGDDVFYDDSANFIISSSPLNIK